MKTQEIIEKTKSVDATPKPVSREEFEELKARFENLHAHVSELATREDIRTWVAQQDKKPRAAD